MLLWTSSVFDLFPLPVHIITFDEIGTGSGEGEGVPKATGGNLPPT